MKKYLSIVLSIALLSLPLGVAVAGDYSKPAEENVTVADDDQGLNDSSANDENAIDDNATDENPIDDNATDENDGDESVVGENAAEDDATEDDAVENGDTESSEEGTAELVDDQEPNDGVIVDGEGNEVEAGITPDSPLYWLDELLEKLKLALTFDHDKKASLIDKQAAENLAEAQKMSEQDDEKNAQKALDCYSKKVEKALAFIEEVQQEDSEKAQKLEEALTRVNANNIQVLGGLLDKLPPQAAQKVALNVVRSMEKAIVKMDKQEQKALRKELKKAEQMIDEERLEEEIKKAVNNFRKTLEAIEAESEDGTAVKQTEDTFDNVKTSKQMKQDQAAFKKETKQAIKDLKKDLKQAVKEQKEAIKKAKTIEKGNKSYNNCDDKKAGKSKDQLNKNRKADNSQQWNKGHDYRQWNKGYDRD